MKKGLVITAAVALTQALAPAVSAQVRPLAPLNAGLSVEAAPAAMAAVNIPPAASFLFGPLASSPLIPAVPAETAARPAPMEVAPPRAAAPKNPGVPVIQSLLDEAPNAGKRAAAEDLSTAKTGSEGSFIESAGGAAPAPRADAVFAESVSGPSPLGGKERPLRVAVIGSGPSGFYSAEALMNQKGLNVQVDMFDRLPTPYGLVRGGVAPDHPKIKTVDATYEKIASRPNFRFFGNVQFGRDITVDDLKTHYDQVVYAVGAGADRKLGIPGEELAGSDSATAFVGWYNSHPDFRGRDFDLSRRDVVVVGAGNVAMDISRILAQDPENLARTDISEYAMKRLRSSEVRRIILLARRGPGEAAFSPAEFKALTELPSADVVVRPQDLEAVNPAGADATTRKNIELLSRQSLRSPEDRRVRIELRFFSSPVEIIGEDGRVSGVRVEKNRLVPDGRGGSKAVGTGEFETLPAGLVLRSVGYYGIALPGVPFDAKSGHISNENGRVADPETRAVVAGAYAAGWAKRGPSGMIGTNKADSAATVAAMLEDIQGRAASLDPEKRREAVQDLLKRRGVEFVTFQDWKLLEQAEIANGIPLNKTREKYASVDDMLAAIRRAKQAGASTAGEAAR